MSRFTNASLKTAVAIAIAIGYGTVSAAPAAPLTNLGRTATPKEIAAWDIDVRPDFKGLPKGSGSVKAGQDVWEGKCASCHGTFGESNEVFTPVIGGTTPEDVKSGRVASLTNGRQPQKTTMMKVATVSTLWDYINRAMPWTAPKSLSADEVYAVTAYILNMAEVVPDDFVLSDKTIAKAQALMPNRNGMQTKHGLWEIKGKADVKSVACMKDCKTDAKVHSSLPEASRDAHGNLALQTRTFGGVRGVDTTKPAPTTRKAAAAVAAAPVSVAAAAPKLDPAALALLKQNGCVACHGVDNKVMGPSIMEVRNKYKGAASANAKLFDSIKKGSSGTWGAIPMPGMAHVKDADVKAIVTAILASGK